MAVVDMSFPDNGADVPSRMLLDFKTARAIGPAIPSSVLAIAEVIE
jgi:hypothetical protein